MNTAPLGLGDTALPWAVTAEVGRPGGRGPWSLAVPKSQDRQIPPTSTRRSVRKPRMAQSPEWRGQGGWARGGPGRGQGGPGPAGMGKVARCSPGPCLSDPPAHLQPPAGSQDSGRAGAGPPGGAAGVMAGRGPHWTQHLQNPLSFPIGSSLPTKTGWPLGTVLMRPRGWAWGGGA